MMAASETVSGILTPRKATVYVLLLARSMPSGGRREDRGLRIPAEARSELCSHYAFIFANLTG